MMMDCFDQPSKHSTSEEKNLPLPQVCATRQTSAWILPIRHLQAGLLIPKKGEMPGIWALGRHEGRRTKFKRLLPLLEQQTQGAIFLHVWVLEITYLNFLTLGRGELSCVGGIPMGIRHMYEVQRKGVRRLLQEKHLNAKTRVKDRLQGCNSFHDWTKSVGFL